MKKVILSSIFALALLASVGFGMNKSMNSHANLSDLALSNVEALADGEGSDFCKWRTDYVSGQWFALCDERGIGYDCTCGDIKSY